MGIPWAKCIRSLPVETNTVFLTFDDGPHPDCTARVLDVLGENEIKATFFVIAEHARKHSDLIARMQRAGHQIGNHSLDHNTWNYFSTLRSLHAWLDRSEELLRDVIGGPTVGFRSPAGVRTPWLHVTLARMQMPWLHWSMRFYDTARPWTAERSQRGALQLQRGDIVLLHDTHRGDRQAMFLQSLAGFVHTGLQRGFKFAAIDADLARAAMSVPKA
jgi:peptidoglycan/xylan/chitin deacetylase (PgdA/CDA1 family)